jgi:plasmid stabilization system protein ParE
MKPVIILDEALEDLEKAHEFYEDQEPGLGDYCITSLLRDAASLSNLHGFHSRRYGFHWMLGTKFPFGLYYLVEEKSVVVYAILDQRSRPSRIQRRLKNRQ